MHRKIAVCLITLFLYGPNAWANDRILAAIPQASIVGQGVLSIAFWDIYEATLYATNGQWRDTQPAILSIEYFVTIDGADIADRSVKEIRKQGFTDEVQLAAWNSQMKNIFPNVVPGSILSATYFPYKETRFYSNGEPIGAIKGDMFGRLFFNIWLGENTSEPQLRQSLLGKS